MSSRNLYLSDVAEVKSSKRIFANEYKVSGVPFFRSKEIGELSRGENIKSELFISESKYEEIKLKFGLPRPGDILLTSVGTIGNTWIVDDRKFYYKDGNLTQISPSKELFNKYLQYFFKSQSFWNSVSNNASGSAYDALTIDKLKKIKISLPEIAIQKKIAEILDTADSLRQKDKTLIEKYNQLTQSLFLEMFGDPVRNEKEWEEIKLGEISTKITDGTHKTPIYLSSGVKFISAKNIKNAKITWEDIKYISEDEHREIYKRCNPEIGDVLVTKSGSIGMAALVKETFEFSLFESLALIKPIAQKIDSLFLRELINCTPFNLFMLKGIKGIGVKHLHLGDIRETKIIIPPLNLQNNFASMIKEIEKQKQLAEASLAQSEALFQSLLQKAFKGELVR